MEIKIGDRLWCVNELVVVTFVGKNTVVVRNKNGFEWQANIPFLSIPTDEQLLKEKILDCKGDIDKLVQLYNS